MTTAQLIILDHVVALACAGTWFAAGAAAASQRIRLGFGLLVAALLMTVARFATVALLVGRGWPFAQEKVLLALPLLGVAAAVAALMAGPHLLTMRHRPDAGADAGRAPGDGVTMGGVVALLTAGYSALAGFVVTIMVGYPLTWSTALIACAIVVVAALLTTYAVAAPSDDDPQAAVRHTSEDDGRAGSAHDRGGGSTVARRRFMSIAGGVAAMTAAVGIGLRFTSSDTVVTGGGPGRRSGRGGSVSVADLRGARSPAQGGTRRRYTLTAQTATVRLPSGAEIQAWTYNGQLPGPTITATAGDLIEVTLRNADITGGVTAHWHGYDVACGEDGAPGATQEAVMPGEEFVYRFRAEQVGTYWYHTHQASYIGVRKGLYGNLVVSPSGAQPDADGSDQLDLRLPIHTFDGTVVIADWDGRADRPVIAGTDVRLRVTNTDSEPHRLALAGTVYQVAAVDGRDINGPGDLGGTALRLPAGGRYDLTFVMPDASVALIVDDDHDGGLRLIPDEQPADGAVVADTSDWPILDLLRYGTPAAIPFDPAVADRHFTMVLDRGLATVDGRLAYAHTVNGQAHPSIPDQLVAEGDLVRFTVINRSLSTHPWHLHGHPMLILSRDGTPYTGSPLWVDTFDVRPGEVWEVAFEAGNPGVWMNHCHNLPHAHQGMMLRLVYDGVFSPFDGSHTQHRHDAVTARR